MNIFFSLKYTIKKQATDSGGKKKKTCPLNDNGLRVKNRKLAKYMKTHSTDRIHQ